MWVDKTYYDEILLNGKIPGSTSSPNSGINMACIYNIGAVESTIPQEEIKVHTCNDLEVSSDSSICELPKVNVPAQIAHTNPKQLSFQNSNDVLVKCQNNINCPSISSAKFDFVNKFSDFYFNMTAFSSKKWFSGSGLRKFGVAQNELFKILIFILIIVLGAQLYCCPLWSLVVSKAFDR